MDAVLAAVEPAETPWRMIGFVSPASVARGIFDFVVPLAVAIFAIVMLVHSATNIAIQPKTPPPTKAIPAVR